jgi:putative ABC transport system permease protein
MKPWKRIQFWTTRRRRERELAREISAHRQMIEDEYLSEGLSPPEARSASLRRLGSSELAATERSRDQWGLFWLEAFLRDVRFASRLLRHRWLLSFAAIVTVAIGVGANTAVVSVLETALLHPLGLRDTDRVFTATVRFDNLHMTHAPDSGVEYRELRSMTDIFSGVSAIEGRDWVSEMHGEPLRLVGRAVTADFFSVFGQHPALGRFFDTADEYAVVLSHRFWQARFGADPSVIGQALMLDGKPYRIIGVAGPGFRFPTSAEVWVPLKLAPERMAASQRGNNMNLGVYARLRDGASPAQAAGRVNAYVAALKSPGTADGGDLAKLSYFIDLEPFSQTVAGDLRRPLWLLWAAALVVLLTGCANISALLLSQTAGRRREMAIRLSLGGTRLQILRQLLVESLMLGVFGGVGGVAVAAVAISLLSNLSLPGQSLLELVRLDYRLLSYGLVLALLSGLAFGIAPAMQLLRDSQTAAMARGTRRRFQDVFVAAEVCAAFVLLVSTGLLLRSLWTIERIQPGFDPAHVTTAYLLKPKQDPGFKHRLVDALANVPGVQAAALAYPVPMSGEGGLTSMFDIRSRHHQHGEPEWHGEAYFVSARFFDTLRIPIVQGRGLADSDNEGAPLICVIDRKLADRFFRNQNPIGQEIGMYAGWARIVGVVANIRGSTLESESRPVVYYSIHQIPFFDQAGVVVRSLTPGAPLIRAAVKQASGAAPVFDVRSMDERIAESLGVRRILAELITAFGAICLLLATVGLAGVAAQMVSERAKEIGVRVAVGARPEQILAHFLGRGLLSAVIGLAAGVLAAVILERRLDNMLYGVEPLDLATFVAASLTVLVVLFPAVLWPAWRASKIDPQTVLRYE